MRVLYHRSVAYIYESRAICLVAHESVKLTILRARNHETSRVIVKLWHAISLNFTTLDYFCVAGFWPEREKEIPGDKEQDN